MHNNNKSNQSGVVLLTRAWTLITLLTILDDLNVTRVSLLTNNPFKVVSLQKLGIEVTSRKPIVMAPNHHSSKYLECKRDRMGHYDLISKYMSSDVENDVS